MYNNILLFLCCCYCRHLFQFGLHLQCMVGFFVGFFFVSRCCLLSVVDIFGVFISTHVCPYKSIWESTSESSSLCWTSNHCGFHRITFFWKYEARMRWRLLFKFKNSYGFKKYLRQKAKLFFDWWWACLALKSPSAPSCRWSKPLGWQNLGGRTCNDSLQF